MLKLANAGLVHAHAHHTRHKELFSHINGWTEILPCALQDIVLFGAAALHKL